MKRRLALAAALTALGGPGTAAADEPDMQTCLAAHEAAQLRLNEARLASARGDLATCSAATCHAAIRTECVRLLEELERNQPTLVVAAARRDGGDVAGATVAVGGRAAVPVDGKPLEIDPGEYELTVEARGHAPVRQRVLVRLGEKNRAVRFLLEPIAPSVSAAASAAPRAEAPAPSGGGWPALTWVLGGVAVVAAGTAGYFYISGFAEDRDLRDACAPGCSADRVDGVRTRFIVADVALGVALLSGAGALWLGLSSKSRPARGVSWRGAPWSPVLVQEHPAR